MPRWLEPIVPRLQLEGSAVAAAAGPESRPADRAPAAPLD
jgi:hypothetical protein